MANKCLIASRRIIDVMREWHYAVDNYEEGKITYTRFKTERKEATTELSGLLKDVNTHCR